VAAAAAATTTITNIIIRYIYDRRTKTCIF